MINESAVLGDSRVKIIFSFHFLLIISPFTFIEFQILFVFFNKKLDIIKII